MFRFGGEVAAVVEAVGGGAIEGDDQTVTEQVLSTFAAPNSFAGGLAMFSLCASGDGDSTPLS